MPIRRRRSSALIFRRCLALLCRLLRGPADRSALIATVRQAIGPDAYLDRPIRSLEHDLHCLRSRWDVVLSHNRGTKTYRLEELPFALFDLSDEDTGTFSFLYHNFPPAAPQGPEVRRLLDRLVGLLPEERRREVRRLRTIPELELVVLDREGVVADVWDAVERAVVERRQLAFSYRPAHRGEGEPIERRHRVEPYGVEFSEGHYYLEAYCLRLQVGEKERTHVGTLRYRLSRIVPGSAQVLPDKLPPGPRPMRTYTIRYRLGPAIAQGGVTPRFAETRVRWLDDGAAEVTARGASLWRARQVLLRYGENCQVLAPPELVAMMRQTIAEMAQGYGLIEENGSA